MSFNATDFLDKIHAQNPKIVSVAGILSPPPLIFYLTIKDSTGVICKDSTTVIFSTFSTFGNTTDEIKQGDSILYQDFPIVGGIPPLNCFWETDYNISDRNNCSPVLWPERDTAYIAVVTDSVGCQTEFAFFIGVTTSNVFNENRNNLFEIYPNPNSGKFKIYKSGDQTSISGVLQIFTSTGQLVFTEEILREVSFSIDLSLFSKGNYWLVFKEKGLNKVYKKIIIH